MDALEAEPAGACRELVEDGLRTLLAGDPPSPLRRAMADATLGGGRRSRATLVLLCCMAVGGRGRDAVPLACAVEMIHAASLALDDLPAMDDDPRRRDAPSLHCRHGEAVTSLTAVALLARAFEIAAGHDRERGTQAVLRIARAVGEAGMCGGQLADLDARDDRRRADPAGPALEDLYGAKTGRLMAVACELGAMAGGADAARCDALADYGMRLGIAYQIADDVADMAADRAEGRANYGVRVGGRAAGTRALELLHEASRAARAAGIDATTLDAFARQLVEGRLADRPTAR
ncbi:MAG: polyprenyl synthetase family protein [Alphaproteobacteria bacterium]|nr:polyprenyl synthetase family protein [Alphaproteobacteria bacterium]